MKRINSIKFIWRKVYEKQSKEELFSVDCLFFNMVSCTQLVKQTSTTTSSEETGFISSISTWKSMGLIPSSLSVQEAASRSAQSDIAEIDEEILSLYQEFVNDPALMIETDIENEDSQNYLNLFDAIANEESIGSIIDKMALVSEDMSIEFENTVCSGQAIL